MTRSAPCAIAAAASSAEVAWSRSAAPWLWATSTSVATSGSPQASSAARAPGAVASPASSDAGLTCGAPGASQCGSTPVTISAASTAPASRWTTAWRPRALSSARHAAMCAPCATCHDAGAWSPAGENASRSRATLNGGAAGAGGARPPARDPWCGGGTASDRGGERGAGCAGRWAIAGCALQSEPACVPSGERRASVPPGGDRVGAGQREDSPTPRFIPMRPRGEIRHPNPRPPSERGQAPFGAPAPNPRPASERGQAPFGAPAAAATVEFAALAGV
jgi:hypothetical protein